MSSGSQSASAPGWWAQHGNGLMNGASGVLGGIGSIVSGFNSGAKQAQQYNQQGMQNQQQQYDQGLGYLNPYQQAGTQALGQYQGYLNQFQDPNQYYNNVMSNYQQSPAAQFQIQQGEQSANRAAAAGGNVGTPAEQKALMQYSQGVSNQDMQQYFNNQMGISNQYGQGLGNLMNQGFGAAGQMNQNRMGLGDAIGNWYQNMGQNAMYGQQAQNQGLFGGIGGILGGIGSLF